MSILFSYLARKHVLLSHVMLASSIRFAERQVSFQAKYPIITRQRVKERRPRSRGRGNRKARKVLPKFDELPRPPISVSVIPAV